MRMMIDLDTLEQIDINGWTLISENENTKRYQKEDIEKRITSFENHSLEEHYKQGRLHGITVGRMHTPFLHYPNKERSIYSIEHYENDALHGASFHFYDDGAKTESDYKNGLAVGVHREWFGNGQLEKETHFSEGEQQGSFKEWFENGQLKEQAQYHNDTLHGERTQYLENGTLKRKQQLVKGQIEGEQFELWGQGKSSTKQNSPYSITQYKDNLPHGEENTYYPNGIVMRNGHFKKGMLHGERNWYHENGKLSIKEQYVNNRLEGERFLYDENGDLESKQVYKNDERLI